VLLIDDAADGRALADHVLTQAGARVRAAASAEQGFALFRAQRPQVIVSDIGMPVHDGYAFMGWVRAAEQAGGGHVPAAALTAFVLPEERARIQRAGFDLHLGKPLMPAELVEAVARLAAMATGKGSG
jgi:CheY-like chemotaxis protein